MASILLRISLLFSLLFPAATSFSIIDAPPHAASQNLAFDNQLGSGTANVSCFGDGFCCCKGCPPGTCPSIYISRETGTLKNKSGLDTIETPCSTDSYCCCSTGCPPGTCTLDPLTAISDSTGQAVLSEASLPNADSRCDEPDSVSLPDPADLRDCCVSGKCPPRVCGSRFKAILPELNELRVCCLNGSCAPKVCEGLFSAFTPELNELRACCDLGICPPGVCPRQLVASAPCPNDLINCCRRHTCPPGVCGGHRFAPNLEPTYIPIITLTLSAEPVTLWARVSTELTYSFVSLVVVRKLDRESDLQPIPNGGTHIADINVHHIPITQALNLTILAGKQYNYLPEQTFEVIDNTDEPDVPDIILGTDFLTKAGALTVQDEFRGDAFPGIPVLVEPPTNATEEEQRQ
jgi:hypothetical protein